MSSLSAVEICELATGGGGVHILALKKARKKNPERLQITGGWKEIANYLGMGVRTVQRYERELHLPIHRPGGQRGTVIAFKSELEEWITSNSIANGLVQRRRALDKNTNKVGADFLRIDSEVALTFSGLALATKTEEKRRRASQVARKAYVTIKRLSPNIKLTEAQTRKLNANLQRLRNELRSLGLNLRD